MAHGYRSLQQWNQWLSQNFLGNILLEAEQKCYSSVLERHFGRHALIIGVPNQSDLLKETSLACHTLLTPLVSREKISSYIESDLRELPIMTGSIDLVLLPHTLEFLDNPRQLLNEACRVIKPEGLIVVSGFNPYSTWGVKKLLTKQKTWQWSGNFIPSYKVKNWLSLADFEMEKQTTTLFAPPIQHQKMYEKLSVMEQVGNKCFPQLGGVYILAARAKVIPLTPIRWKWKQKLSSMRINASIPGHIARQSK